MQDSQLRWMIGLSLLVLVLIAALGIESEKSDSVDPDATAIVLELPDPNAVIRIERVVSGETLSLVRTEDGWSMKQPDEADADPDVVERFLDDLRELDRGIPVDIGDVPAADFGLGDPPSATVHLTLLDGTEIHAIYGEHAPAGWRTYARDRDGAVVAVGGRSELLLQPSGAFRDHRVFRLDPALVRRVTLEGDGHRLSVSGKGSTWWLEGFTRADPDRVDDLVMGLLDLRFDRLMDLRDPIAEPRATVEIELEDGTVHEVLVGDRTPMGDLVEAPTGMGMVFPESLAILGIGPTDVGDRQALPLGLERDDRVVLETAEKSWEAVRDAGTWKSPDRDDAATWARVNGLARAGIAYRMEPVDAPESIAATVRIYRADKVRTVQIGPADPDGFHRAQDADGGSPYRIRAAELGALEL